MAVLQCLVVQVALPSAMRLALDCFRMFQESMAVLECLVVQFALPSAMRLALHAFRR